MEHVEQPDLKASVKLANVVADGQPVGQAAIEAHSQGKTVYYTAKSTAGGDADRCGWPDGAGGELPDEGACDAGPLDVGKPLATVSAGRIAGYVEHHGDD